MKSVVIFRKSTIQLSAFKGRYVVTYLYLLSTQDTSTSLVRSIVDREPERARKEQNDPIERMEGAPLMAEQTQSSLEPSISDEQEDHERTVKNYDNADGANNTSAVVGSASSENKGDGALSGAAPIEVEANEPSDSDAEVGAFDLLASRKRKKKKAKTSISIGLPSPAKQDETKKQSTQVDALANIRALDFLKEEEEICYDFDFDAEDQDVNNSQTNVVIDSHLQDEAALLAEKEADVAKIQAYLKSKWEDRTKDVQNQINKLRAEMLLKQERQREQLADNHKRHLAEDEKRMDEGLAWLRLEQKKELEMKLQKYQEDEQEGTLDQESTMEWNTFMAQLKVAQISVA